MLLSIFSSFSILWSVWKVKRINMSAKITVLPSCIEDSSFVFFFILHKNIGSPICKIHWYLTYLTIQFLFSVANNFSMTFSNRRTSNLNWKLGELAICWHNQKFSTFSYSFSFCSWPYIYVVFLVSINVYSILWDKLKWDLYRIINS